MDNIKESLASLADADPKDLAKALHEAVPDAYQYIFRSGHSTATERGNSKIESVSAEAETLRSEIETYKKRLETIQAEKPDISKVEAKYQAALEAKDEENRRLQGTLKEKDQEFLTRTRQRSLEISRERVRNELVGTFGVDPDYARVMVMMPEFEKRVRFDETGEVTGAVQADDATPLPVYDGKSLEAALARDLAGAIPKKFIEDRRQGSSRLGSTDGSGKRTYSEAQIAAMTEKEYAEAREDILAAAGEGRIAS